MEKLAEGCAPLPREGRSEGEGRGKARIENRKEGN
jgi:hypothetical protein